MANKTKRMKLQGSPEVAKLVHEQAAEIERLERELRTRMLVTVGDDSEEPQSRWGFDPAFELAVCLLAETPMTEETEGVAGDFQVDELIAKARNLRKREEDALERGEKE